ncbi:hypothetical protein CTZ27_11870 [Streptomyces griseocarneus]|nr:hypothetical protein CTZ27_11870 [Streptomyces griseocarneus]
MDIDLRHLRSFVALAEEQHFSQASAGCRVSRPALTRAVRGLEDTLGVRLVDRTTRSVALTPAGRRLDGALSLARCGPGRICASCGGSDRAPGLRRCRTGRCR